jgi:hypothetical protein
MGFWERINGICDEVNESASGVPASPGSGIRVLDFQCFNVTYWYLKGWMKFIPNFSENKNNQ